MGNCSADLAGRRLEFRNPVPKPCDLAGLVSLQRGVVGEVTASRKAKVPDFPLEELEKHYQTGRESTWHWGNCLYLEWFGERNGRAVIESVSFELNVIGEPQWQMNEQEAAQQQEANATAMKAFMDRLANVLNRPLAGNELAETETEHLPKPGDLQP